MQPGTRERAPCRRPDGGRQLDPAGPVRLLGHFDAIECLVIEAQLVVERNLLPENLSTVTYDFGLWHRGARVEVA